MRPVRRIRLSGRINLVNWLFETRFYIQGRDISLAGIAAFAICFDAAFSLSSWLQGKTFRRPFERPGIDKNEVLPQLSQAACSF